MLNKLVSVLLVLTLHLNAKENKMQSLYDYNVTTINGEATTLSSYKGKVMLIVNVASKCGFTPQYEGLQALYAKYKERGFVVLGFPCNQFGGQEPADEPQIATFCRVNFGVTFPMFAKIDVNGKNTHPLYVYLKSQQSGTLGIEMIKWNFTKFLIDREGNVIKRFAPSDTPQSLEKEIEKLL